MTTSNLNPNNTFLLSFWAKSAGGQVNISGPGTVTLSNSPVWTYYEYQITNLSAITLKRIGTIEVLVDEIKVRPMNATVTSNTYDPFFGVTSSTDGNDRSVYTVYDTFGRQKFILDENRNIIKAFNYNFKK
jgi:hypothetical protein